MKKSLIIATLLFIIIGFVWFTLKSPLKIPHFDISKAGCQIIKLDSEGKIVKTCFSVPYQMTEDKLKLYTVAHFFEGKAGFTYELVFHSGIKKKIEVLALDKEIDIALIGVDIVGLNKGSDYLLPKIYPVDFVDEKREVFIYNDEFYVSQNRSILKVFKNNSIRYFGLSGKIEKGRSGSPVFFPNSDFCLGVIQGYNEATSSSEAYTQVICLFDLDGKLKVN